MVEAQQRRHLRLWSKQRLTKYFRCKGFKPPSYTSTGLKNLIRSVKDYFFSSPSIYVLFMCEYSNINCSFIVGRAWRMGNFSNKEKGAYSDCHRLAVLCYTRGICFFLELLQINNKHLSCWEKMCIMNCEELSVKLFIYVGFRLGILCNIL